MIDGREGVTAGDEIIAAELRRAGKPVILVVNKCESRASDAGVGESYALGFGEPVAVSAEHGIGFADLLAALQPFAEQDEEAEAPEEAEDGEEERGTPTGRSGWPLSAAPMSASRACSTASWARSAR